MSEALYLSELKRALAGLPRPQRDELISQVRSHFTDAAAEGRNFDETAAALGSPADVARQARDELAAPRVAKRSTRTLQWAAFAFAVVAAVFAAYIMPADVSATTSGSQSLAETLGFGIVLVLLIPALIAIVPVVSPTRWQWGAALASAIVLSLGCLAYLFELGFYFLPAAWLAWAALLVPWVRQRGYGRIARWVGGLIVAVVPVFGAIGMVRGALGMNIEAIVAEVLLLAIAVGIVVRWRPAFAVAFVIGGALLVGAMLQPGLLLLAMWAQAGVLITVGLAGWLGTSRTGA